MNEKKSEVGVCNLVQQIIEEVKADVCDNICKYREEFGHMYDEQIEAICEKCPLNRL